jgi:hypothetical protein
MKFHLQLSALAALAFLIPFLSLRPAGAEVGNDNPTGVNGHYNGNITTGGSYDPYTGNAKRFVTDLTVTGSVGSYPLAREEPGGTATNGDCGSSRMPPNRIRPPITRDRTVPFPIPMAGP